MSYRLLPGQGIALLTALLLALKGPEPCAAQSPTMTLPEAIGVVTSTHPLVLQAEQGVAITEQQLELVRASRLPQVEAIGTYERIAPRPLMRLPFGDFPLMPNDNYNAMVQVQQLIYSFSPNTRRRNDILHQERKVQEYSLGELRQALALETVSAAYTLRFLDSALSINIQEQRTLEAHLQQVERLRNTGSALDYQKQATEVQLSKVQAQRMALISQQQLQQADLQALLGEDYPIGTRVQVIAQQFPILSDSAATLDYALENRNEIKAARAKREVALLETQMAHSSGNPVLAWRGTAGAKNGYPHRLTQMTLNYSIGLELRIPIYMGARTKVDTRISELKGRMGELEIEKARRQVIQQVRQRWAQRWAVQQQLAQYQRQTTLSQAAYRLAEVNFRAGAITNASLLEASTNVALSQLMAQKAQTDLQIATYALLQAIGYPLY